MKVGVMEKRDERLAAEEERVEDGHAKIGPKQL
jgi:hypothetical protein